MNPKRRIPYIDYLRGLSVTWVVWYHTEHPAFVDFSFRIPLFFFVSGIFFKAYSFDVFWRKKFNQLIVPFVLFYLLYYVFLILLSGFKYHDFSAFDYSWIGDIFGAYKNTESFRVNPPLWFICALLNLQIIYYILNRISQNKLFLLISSASISIFGILFIRNIPTPFIIGRSLPYLIYYALGSIVGKNLMYYINNRKNEIKVLTYAIIGFAIFLFIDYCIDESHETAREFNYYPLILSFIVLLIVFFKNFSRFKTFKPLMFFGINSYIVLGMHEIYHTSFRIFIENHVSNLNVWWGMVQTTCTLLLLVPTIYILNRLIPRFVAKKELLRIPTKPQEAENIDQNKH